MKTLLSFLVALSALGVAACNTVEGVGRDVQSAGEAVEGASQDAQQ